MPGCAIGASPYAIVPDRPPAVPSNDSEFQKFKLTVSRLTVLVIDGALDQLDLYEMALQEAYYLTLGARCGALGYDVAVTEAPDVIIAEAGLPDVDGWELCGWLKANPLTTAIPVIILTARHDYDIPLRALDANISELLYKPCALDRLHSAIKRVLGHNGR